MKKNLKVSLLEKTHLKESQNNPVPNASKFEVVLIQEGLGNLRDCFYYTKESLQNSVPLFEGKKAMVDHPSMIEEESRPERSTRDIMGYYENVRYQESDEGRGMLVADLNIVDDPEVSLPKNLLLKAIEYSKRYPNSDFVGFSINAVGEADEVPVDEFIKNNRVPLSVLEKINEAKSNGIEIIRVVSQLKDATSCDLVTEAGAGGKILKMIEMEKKPMKQNEMKQNEMVQKKESKEKEGMESQNQNPSAPGGGGDHADADQDRALFQDMIKKYLGDDHSNNEEAMEMARHAYEAHREKGLDHEAACEAAGNHLQMAAEVGKRMAQHETHESSHENESESHHEGCGNDSDSDSGSQTPFQKKKMEKETHYESKKILQLSGENARLKESLKKYELNDYLDKKLKESGKSNQLTKSFREAIGQLRSKEQIDSSYKIFMAGLSQKEELEDFSSFLIPEKVSLRESKEVKEVNFSDCLS